MKTIAWDVDDVLNDLMRCWFQQHWLLIHPDCKLKYRDIIENPPHRVLGINLKEYLDSLDVFRLSKKADQMQPVPEVVSWFSKYGKYFRHIALTARPLNTISSASAWVFRYFGAWIRGFHFIPAYRKGQYIPEYDRGKGEYLLRTVESDVLVDDDPANIDKAGKFGIKGVLMPRPWNKGSFTIEEVLNSLVGVQSKRIYHANSNKIRGN